MLGKHRPQLSIASSACSFPWHAQLARVMGSHTHISQHCSRKTASRQMYRLRTERACVFVLVYVCVCVSLSLCLCLSVSLCVSLCLPVCVCVCVCVSCPPSAQNKQTNKKIDMLVLRFYFNFFNSEFCSCPPGALERQTRQSRHLSSPSPKQCLYPRKRQWYASLNAQRHTPHHMRPYTRNIHTHTLSLEVLS